MEDDPGGNPKRMPRLYSECLVRYPDGRCPWARCSNNLMIDVTPAGSLVLNRPIRPRLQRGERGGGRGGRGRATETIAQRGGDPKAIDLSLEQLTDWWIDRGVPTCERWWSSHGGKSYQDINLTLEEIGDLNGTTRERARQIEVGAFRKLAPLFEALGLAPEGARQAGAVSSPKTADVEDDDDEGDPGDRGGAGAGGAGVGDGGDDSGGGMSAAQAGEIL